MAAGVPRFYVDPDLEPSVGVTVLLARHGSHDELGRVLSGRSDIGLNEAGHAEAARLADRLAGTPLAAIHSSPRRRARQTADAVARLRHMGVNATDALDEIDFGGWCGRSFASLYDEPDWRHWNDARSKVRAPGGETMAEATGRALSLLETLGPEGATHLCVSHCDVIRGVVARCLGLDADRLLGFDVDPGSLSAIAFHAEGARVLCLNEQPR